MKRMIDHLKEQDALLKRQMMELRLENQQLKSINDHLRGKIMAKKMLDQYFERHPDIRLPTMNDQTASSPCVNNDDVESVDSF
ncbi:uncharacterized protein BX664DRAFT_329624 [Halteromyces radiatus]|uniref:uncharacterized protein n=1 Tax=Halteromyces radiatus TaxID=101107 RepID=UPI002220E92B|nr:uncharacterized protein BX664DRAFT_329624 [Halteromyces radiatus]KAI8093400.1 hypothetical protein BX664DRAFT_329624 [Halteromyces radiatus]